MDFDALRSKLNSLQEKNSRSQATWKPKEGTTQIRLVPLKDNKDNPFTEMLFHYLGNKVYLSPQTFGRPDPIADFADSLKSTGDREDWIRAKQFTPKLRTFALVVVRGEEEEGVRFWSFGKTVYKDLLAIIADPDYGDITDPTSGRDIKVEFIPQKKSDTNFSKTNVRIKPNQTPLSADAEQLKKFLTEQPVLSELFTEPTFEELKTGLHDFLGASKSVTGTEKSPSKVVVDDEEELVAVVAKEVKQPEKTTVTPPKDVKAKFEELFGED